MAEVVLAAATRSALLDLQRTTQLTGIARQRLETGRRVNQPIDDAPAFFQAQSLSNRAGDLLALKDSIGQAATAIGGAEAGIDAIGEVTRQLKGVALAARGGSAETRAQAAAQFDRLRSQIDGIAADASAGGVNLLANPAENLAVDFNAQGSTGLVVQGRPSDAQSLSIGSAAADHNGFAADADIDAAVAGLAGALDRLRASQSALGSNAGLLNTRLDFTTDLTNALGTGAAKLVNADLNEQAAKLVSLRVAGQLGAVGLSIAQQSQRAVLQLF